VVNTFDKNKAQITAGIRSGHYNLKLIFIVVDQPLAFPPQVGLLYMCFDGAERRLMYKRMWAFSEEMVGFKVAQREAGLYPK
jgi:hypothetical protein